MAPLIQSGSKKALKKNIETEMKANPEKDKRDQNLAIAYSVQRKNRKKKAHGGMIEEEMPESLNVRAGSESSLDEMEAKSKAEMAQDKAMRMSKGGMAEMPESLDIRAGDEASLNDMEELSEKERMADRAMRMAYGGGVDLDMVHKARPDDAYDAMGKVKYAQGGMLGKEMPVDWDLRAGSEEDLDEMEHMSLAEMVRDRAMKMAYGGMAKEMPVDWDIRAGSEIDLNHMEDESDEEMHRDAHEMVMKKYSAGGKVKGEASYNSFDDIDQNAVEHSNYYDKLNHDLGDNESYSEQSALDDVSHAEDERSDDGQDSRDIDGDEYDLVSKVRRKYAR